MKKGLIFLAGFISGIICLVVFSLIVTRCSSGNIEGLTIYDEPGDVISASSFEVFQVVQQGNALAFAGEPRSHGGYSYIGMVVLFLADETTHYYDEQIITIPRGKCVRQIGIHQYNTEDGYKTVPVVAIFDR